MKIRRFYNTLLGRVATLVAAIVFIFIILITVINLILYRNQLESTLTYARMNLESSNNVSAAQLEVLSSFYQNMFANNVNYQQLKKPVSEQAYYMAASQILKDMDDIFFSYNGISFTYCYIADKDYLIQSSSHPNYEASEKVKEYLKARHAEREGEVFTQSTWHLAEILGRWYLFNTIRQKSFEIGIVIEADTILKNTHILDEFKEGMLFLTDENGDFITGIFSENGTIRKAERDDLQKPRMLLIETAVSDAPIVMSLLIPQATLLETPRKQLILNISAFITALVLMFLLGIYYFYQYTVKPVEKIAEVAKGLGGGELDQRLPETGQIEEISEINRNFNQLISAITALKIDLYEEKLRHQEAELAQLRLQLNPHFLLNSLSLVYTMIRQQHYDVAMQFSMGLIRHFRFILKKSHNFVPLSDELDFCENYMEILALQYPSSFSYEILLEDDTMRKRVLVPPLSIENLIENAVKYGLTQEKELHVEVTIREESREGFRFSRYIVRDNGPGFSQEAFVYLQKILDGDKIENIASDGVGLKNLIERLSILYEGKAEITFTNNESGGAEIVMVIPSE